MNRISIRSAARIYVLALVISALVSLSIFAQDAGQVLQLSVGFRTLKNRVTMSDEKRQEVEALEAKARKANEEKQFGEAVKHLMHGMALMRNRSWTPMSALVTASRFNANKIVFDPEEMAQFKLWQIFTLDEQVGVKITVGLKLFNSKGEWVNNLKAIRDIPADFTTPLKIEAKIPKLPDGDYDLLVNFRNDFLEQLNRKKDDELAITLKIRIAKGLSAEAELLKKRVTSIRGDLEGRHLISDQMKLIQALPPAEYAASLIDLINTGGLQLERVNLQAEIDNANNLLDHIVKGEHPLAGQRGDIRWAYMSAVDKTPQPYRLFIPSGYDAKRKWPLVVALHGMGGDENSFFTSYKDGEIKRIAEARGYIVVCPKGRGPADMYLGRAERDVLDVLKDVKREYAIDNDRVYLMGHSMGGYGTWSVAVNNPDLFAALAPISGGGNPLVVAKLKAITNVPWIVVHGDKDPTVSVEESRKMVKAGKELGIEIKYLEVPGGDHSSIAVPAFKDIFDWFDAHKRQPAGAKAAAKAAGGGQ